ncbi:zinc ribbon domain-containing protein [Echinimonas agarilytica]|uniref:Zinc ribbon domain-containing protein n=1 Tax=Echinimonas agarilytica TaxID=1215918 RepID=A0AA41W7Z1_9GAMM|nr:zinc ribbon domain-containing protein [Echinimonas agarilytica]MCM2680132.1 zinc ribbon domain-containing protein [Echinimonas agarilytica]
MTLRPKCPKCQGYLVSDAQEHRCEECSSSYEAQAVCNTCGDPLSLLKACGAVDYFCNHCNELKSKSVVKYRYLELGHQIAGATH